MSHDGHGFQRVRPHRCFARQHDGVRAFIDGGGDVRGLGPRGDGRGDHGLQHLGRHDDWPTSLAAFADDGALRDRHLLRRQFHAKIATGHHDGVGGLDDLSDALQRLGLLDLGDQPGTAADAGAQVLDIACALHERQRNPVHSQRQAELEIGDVLGGQRAERQDGVGHVDALARAQHAPGHDARVYMGRRAGDHLQSHAAIVKQQ
ncbi:hypothetical protein D3C71_1454300 [compost metagenome]